MNSLKTFFLLSLLTIPRLNTRAAKFHMFIVNPLTGGGMMALFSTHPPMEECIARLESLAHR